MTQTEELLDALARCVNSLSPIAETYIDEHKMHDPWWVAWTERAQAALTNARQYTGQKRL